MAASVAAAFAMLFAAYSGVGEMTSASAQSQNPRPTLAPYSTAVPKSSSSVNVVTGGAIIAPTATRSSGNGSLQQSQVGGAGTVSSSSVVSNGSAGLINSQSLILTPTAQPNGAGPRAVQPEADSIPGQSVRLIVIQATATPGVATAAQSAGQPVGARTNSTDSSAVRSSVDSSSRLAAADQTVRHLEPPPLPRLASAPGAVPPNGQVTAQQSRGEAPSFTSYAASRRRPAMPSWPRNPPPVDAATLDAYLASKASPLAGMGNALLNVGWRYNIDPRLLVAISGADTGYGRVICTPFNAWNWFWFDWCNSPFDSWEQAMDEVARGLRVLYLDDGLMDVYAIARRYGPLEDPRDTEGLNQHWPNNVVRILEELGGHRCNLSWVSMPSPACGAAPAPGIPAQPSFVARAYPTFEPGAQPPRRLEALPQPTVDTMIERAILAQRFGDLETGANNRFFAPRVQWPLPTAVPRATPKPVEPQVITIVVEDDEEEPAQDGLPRVPVLTALDAAEREWILEDFAPLLAIVVGLVAAYRRRLTESRPLSSVRARLEAAAAA
ncbi:MAG: hypothetical protein U0821_11530 [Chloroflexota bacterium]